MDFWKRLDSLITVSPIVIDRPKGSAHPRYPDMVYPLDYGYLKGTSGGDGNEIDVWRGTLGENRLVAVVLTVDAVKRDTEMKLLIGCTGDEIEIVNRFYNNNDSMSGMVVLRDM